MTNYNTDHSYIYYDVWNIEIDINNVTGLTVHYFIEIINIYWETVHIWSETVHFINYKTHIIRMSLLQIDLIMIIELRIWLPIRLIEQKVRIRWLDGFRNQYEYIYR